MFEVLTNLIWCSLLLLIVFYSVSSLVRSRKRNNLYRKLRIQGDLFCRASADFMRMSITYSQGLYTSEGLENKLWELKEACELRRLEVRRLEKLLGVHIESDI